MIREIYNRTLRRVLPRKIAAFNGVPVRRPKLLDQTDVRPGWEATFIDAINRVTKPGDDVVEIGGGYGVTAVIAARIVGDEGSVTVYEPSKESVDVIEETAVLNRVENTISVVNAAVGEVKESFLGDLVDESKNITPGELPEADVLLLDCEGAELDIIRSMTIRPRNMVIETHPRLGAPTDEVIGSLPSGYSVLSVDELDEESELEKEDDIRVLSIARED